MPMIGRPKQPKALPKSLPADAITALPAAVSTEPQRPRSTDQLERDRAIILTGLLAGLRADEMVRANIGDLRRTDDGAVLQVRGKGDKDQRIPANPSSSTSSSTTSTAERRASRPPMRRSPTGGLARVAGVSAAVRRRRRPNHHPRHPCNAGHCAPSGRPGSTARAPKGLCYMDSNIRWTAGLCALPDCFVWWGPCRWCFRPHNPGGRRHRPQRVELADQGGRGLARSAAGRCWHRRRIACLFIPLLNAEVILMGEADVRDSVDRVLAALRDAGRAEGTVRRHQPCWTGSRPSWLGAAWTRRATGCASTSSLTRPGSGWGRCESPLKTGVPGRFVGRCC